MTEVTGERTFSFEGRTVAKMESKLIPPGTHTLVVGADASVAKADRPDAVPYVNISFGVRGTETSEGGKMQRVFHRLFIGLKPGKDGVVNMERENGLLALAQGLGTLPPECTIIERDATDADGNTVKLEYLNPVQVVEWLKSFSFTELQGRIKTEKGTGGYSDKSAISKFLLPVQG